MIFECLHSRDAKRPQDKADVVRRTVEMLLSHAKAGRDDIESVTYAILRREELGSTGIGRSIAVPHTKHPFVNQFHSGCFLLEKPVDFDSLDDLPVRVVFSMVSPPDRPGDHLRAIENISRVLRLLKDDVLILPFDDLEFVMRHYYKVMSREEPDYSQSEIEWYRTLIRSREAIAAQYPPASRSNALLAAGYFNFVEAVKREGDNGEAKKYDDEVLRLITEVLRAQPTDPIAAVYGTMCYWKRGWVLTESGQHELAMHLYGSVIELWNNAGLAAENKKPYNKCLALSYLVAGCAAGTCGDLNKSMEWFTEAVDLGQSVSPKRSLAGEANTLRAITQTQLGVSGPATSKLRFRLRSRYDEYVTWLLSPWEIGLDSSA